jgi:hypothetical protein
MFIYIGYNHLNVPLEVLQALFGFPQTYVFQEKQILTFKIAFHPNLPIELKPSLGPVVPRSLSFCNPGLKGFKKSKLFFAIHYFYLIQIGTNKTICKLLEPTLKSSTEKVRDEVPALCIYNEPSVCV